jgi:hypothetical protein
MSRFAPIRLRPTPPALLESRKMTAHTEARCRRLSTHAHRWHHTQRCCEGSNGTFGSERIVELVHQVLPLLDWSATIQLEVAPRPAPTFRRRRSGVGKKAQGIHGSSKRWYRNRQRCAITLSVCGMLRNTERTSSSGESNKNKK